MFSRLMNATRYGTTHILEFMSRLSPERPSDMRMELRGGHNYMTSAVEVTQFLKFRNCQLRFLQKFVM